MASFSLHAGVAAEKRTAVTWAQRLKRVFDIEICQTRDSAMKITAPAHPCALGISASLHVIACIEDPAVIKKILDT